jgi:phosphate starvation-inducible PhoH-like protein
VVQTQEMVGRLRAHHAHRYELPLVSQPVQFAARPVGMDPYALGLLLGDGCITISTTPTFTTRDSELVSALGSAFDGTVTTLLREVGVAGTDSRTKFIPLEYLFNGPDVRLAVLQGLLDSDGGPVTQAGRSCRIEYSTCSPQLRDDVAFLVRSLGGVAYSHVRPAEGRPPGLARGRPVYHRADTHRIEIRLPTGLVPFRLERKAEKYRQHGGGRPMRFVHSIEPAGEAETVCIQVGAEDSLYVTDDFIVTHNTLNNSFIILDEAQNTTPEQMKMFLTRIGFGSKVVITGDDTQIDLAGARSGLVGLEEILTDIDGLAFVRLDKRDVVRHRIVQDIVHAYERAR